MKLIIPILHFLEDIIALSTCNDVTVCWEYYLNKKISSLYEYQDDPDGEIARMLQFKHMAQVELFKKDPTTMEPDSIWFKTEADWKWELESHKEDLKYERQSVFRFIISTWSKLPYIFSRRTGLGNVPSLPYGPQCRAWIVLSTRRLIRYVIRYPARFKEYRKWKRKFNDRKILWIYKRKEEIALTEYTILAEYAGKLNIIPKAEDYSNLLSEYDILEQAEQEGVITVTRYLKWLREQLAAAKTTTVGTQTAQLSAQP